MLMIHRNIVLTLLYLFSVATLAQTNDSVQHNPTKWSAVVESGKESYSTGETFSLLITAEIEKGWHLYSMDEIQDGPRPTRISLLENDLFRLAIDPIQPEPLTKFDSNFGIETKFFKDSATFILPIQIKPSKNKGMHQVTVQVRFQTCTEEICLPPKTIRLTSTVNIK